MGGGGSKPQKGANQRSDLDLDASKSSSNGRRGVTPASSIEEYKTVAKTSGVVTRERTRDAFQNADADSSSGLDFMELKEEVKRKGLVYSEERVQELFRYLSQFMSVIGSWFCLFESGWM